MDHEELAGLLTRVRAGDETATRILLQSFEDDVRKAVRGRLPRALRTQFDSMDFVQSVWQSFFSSCDQDPEAFQDARHLRGYLAGVARNKVLEVHRQRTRTKKYDMNREERLDVRRGDQDVQRELPAARPDAQPGRAGQRPARRAHRRPEPRGGPHRRAPPAGADAQGDRRTGRQGRALGPSRDRIDPRRMSARALQAEPERGSE